MASLGVSTLSCDEDESVAVTNIGSVVVDFALAAGAVVVVVVVSASVAFAAVLSTVRVAILAFTTAAQRMRFGGNASWDVRVKSTRMVEGLQSRAQNPDNSNHGMACWDVSQSNTSELPQRQIRLPCQTGTTRQRTMGWPPN